MKKAVLILLVILILAWPLQAYEFKRIVGPVFSGFSRPWPGPVPEAYPVYVDTGSNWGPLKNSRLAVFGGLGLEFPLSRLLELEVDGIYKECGSQYRRDNYFYASYLYEFQMREISFPLLLKGHFWKESRPYFLAGADLSFILSHRYHLFYRAEASQILEKIMEADIKSYTRTTDLALVLGLGFEVAVKKRMIAIEGRYEIGLPSIWKGTVSETTGRKVSVRSRQLLLVISYIIK